MEGKGYNNWQISRSCVRERNAFMFNNELISDVRFVVESSCAAGKKQVTSIPAHKYVLAVSSPVFLAMFYGGFPEPKDCIKLPNCDSQSCLEFLRYLYCDEVHLTREHVLQILNLAKKYIVPSLEDKCVAFVEKNISADSVFDILTFAQGTFDGEHLERLCWEFIDLDSEAKCLNTEAFLDIDKKLLTALVSRNSLSMREVLLYEGVDWWAAHNRSLGTSWSARRSALGDTVLNQIRFPLMSEEELRTFVIPSSLLTVDEVNAIFAYFKTGLTDSIKFPTFPRVGTVNRLSRFLASSFGFFYEEYRPDVVSFTVSEPVFLEGVRLFGSEGKEYSVSVQISCESSNFEHQLVKSRIFQTETELKRNCFGFDVMFSRPFALDKDVEYCIAANIKGQPSFYGCYGRTRMMGPDNVEFKFNYGPYPLHTGQFADILYHKA